MEKPLRTTTNTNMNILSYLDYEKLLLLEKTSPIIKKLMTHPKFWALKLKRDYDIDVMKYPPKNYRNMYIAKYKLDRLLQEGGSEIVDNFDEILLHYVEYSFEELVMGEVVDGLISLKVTELESELMFILLDMEYMLDLKTSQISYIQGSSSRTVKEMLIFILSLYYLNNLINKKVVSFNEANQDMIDFLSNNANSNMIIMMATFPDVNIQDIVGNFLKLYPEIITEVRMHMEEKGHLNLFKKYFGGR